MIDRVLINGSIRTLDPERPLVSALAIHGERILAWGDDAEMLALAGPHTIREDLGGRTVIPGLTDAHLHWEWTARGLQQVDLFEVPTREEAVDRVAARVSQTPPGEWIVGHGWTQAAWPDGAFPTAAHLDTVAPENPVYLRAKSGHAVWVNTAALKLCGIHASTPDPDGGQIGRDTSGQPSGILFETAIDLVARHVPDPTPEQLADQMLAAQELALASGLTGFHDFDGPSCLTALQLLRERDQLALRVVKNVNKEWIHHVHELGLRWGFGDDWLRLGGLKIFADGALGPRTALMVEPYEGEPDNTGIAVSEPAEMLELVSRASAAGMPSTIHAIGDLAVRRVLDVYEAVRQQEQARGVQPSARRHRIEHVQIVHPDDAHRLAELNIIASMQPNHATSDYAMADRYWGDRCRWAYNPRLQLDQGVVVAFGSDSPIDSCEPLPNLYAAVARRRPDGSPGPQGWYPEACLTLDEALRGFTTGPAYAAGMEDRLGRLTPGCLADLVVLDRDIFTQPPEALLETKVTATMVGGAWRYGGL